MAELIGVAIEVAKCIAEPIKRQFNYLCCFNTNIQNLRDEDTKLDNIKVGVEGQVDAAMNNVQVITPEVKAWLNEVNMIQANMSRIDSEILNVRSGCLAIKSRFLLSRKATKMAAAMKELQDGRGNFGQICHPPPPAAMTSSIPVGQTYELETRKHFEDEIMETLREKKVSMMGICGMGGVGKTTMAKKIMSRARGESLFDEIVMVVVSQTVDMLRIQKDMAELLSLKLEFESLAARAHQLRSRLTSAKSILIVFDDLWEALILEDLGIPYQKECTILLTSRVADVFRQMGVEKPCQFQINILSNKEALSLFKEKVGARADDPRLSPIAEKIVQECQGLPLALVTVGLALKDEEDKAIWENAEQELTTCNPEGIPNYIENVYNPLRLSYDKLGNNEHAKSMFLLCCLFPEDHNIRIFDLCLYTWGLDMFNRIPSLRDTRNKVQASVKTLKSRSLLLDSYDERYVKMHDVVRDVGIFIAEEKGLMSPSWPRKKSNCTWISLFDAQKITLPQGLAFPMLQFLLIERQCSLPKDELPLGDNFLESAENLHVLSIQKYELKCLPHTIKLLKNLRSLIIVSCDDLEDISVVGELVSLEIMYCQWCEKIKELPVEIGRLNQLKLLYIEDCESLERIAAGVISRLISLEELTLINSFTKWESGASEGKNAALCELNSLSSLTTLRIEIEDASLVAQQIHLPNVVEFNITIGPKYFPTTYGRAMQLKLERDGNIGDWIHRFVRSSESLELCGEGSSKLIILDKAKMASLSDGNTTGFPLLEFLVLKDIDNLEELHRGPISSDSFKNLKGIRLESLPKVQHLWNVVPLFCNLSSIYISKCHSLRRLFPWAMGNDSLLRLESLTVMSCSMLEVMWDDEDGKEIGQSSRITFPNLEKLTLFDLPRLTTFCKGINSAEFPALTRMEIKKCPNLKSLVSDHTKCWDDDSLTRMEIVVPLLPEIQSLQRLTIFGNDNLEEIHKGPISSDSYKNLQQIVLCDLPKVQHLCNVVPLFCNLSSIKIVNCHSLRSLFPWAMGNNSLLQLKILKVKSCSMLEVMWDVEHGKEIGESSITFPNLEKVILFDLPRLTTLCKGINSAEFPALTRMEIKKCPNLKSLVSDHTKCWDDDSLHLFCKLDQVAFDRLVLVIDGCDSISSLWCDQIPIDSFTGLVDLTVYNCGNIKSLFSPLIAGNFVNLEYLRIENCHEMVKVVKGKVDEVERCPFIKLEVLSLKGLPKLKAFCDWSCALQLPSLKSLNISECPEMERLLSGSLTSPISSYSFKNLQTIEILSCSMLEQVMLWNEEKVNGESSRITFPKLEKLSLEDLPMLTSFCKGIQSIEFPLLYSMEILKCPNLKSVVSSTENDHICSGAVNHDSLHLFCKSQAVFCSLENLTIGGYENSISERSWSLWCDQIPVDFFTGLVHLKVSNCGNIKSLFSASIARNLVNLGVLTIESCCEMVKVIEDEDEVERSPFIKLEMLFLTQL